MMTKKTQGSTKLAVIIVVLALVATGVVAYMLISRSNGDSNGKHRSDDSSKVTEQDGRTKSNTMPSDLPSDIPIYTPSEVQSATTDRSNGSTSYMINLTSNDSAEKVLAFYGQKLNSDGWTILRNDPEHNLIAAHSGTKDVNLSVQRIGDTPTMIMLNVVIMSGPEISAPNGS